MGSKPASLRFRARADELAEGPEDPNHAVPSVPDPGAQDITWATQTIAFSNGSWRTRGL